MTLVAEVGRRMGEAMSREKEIDLRIMFFHSCMRCGHGPYVRLVWLRKHYKKTGHWK